MEDKAAFYSYPKIIRWNFQHSAVGAWQNGASICYS